MPTSNWRKILKLIGFIILLMVANYTVRACLPTSYTQVLTINDAVSNVALWWRWLSGPM